VLHRCAHCLCAWPRLYTWPRSLYTWPHSLYGWCLSPHGGRGQSGDAPSAGVALVPPRRWRHLLLHCSWREASPARACARERPSRACRTHGGRAHCTRRPRTLLLRWWTPPKTCHRLTPCRPTRLPHLPRRPTPPPRPVLSALPGTWGVGGALLFGQSLLLAYVCIASHNTGVTATLCLRAIRRTLCRRLSDCAQRD